MEVIYFIFTSLSAVQIYDFPNILKVGEIRFTATTRAVLKIPTSCLYDRIEENFVVLAYVCHSLFDHYLSFQSEMERETMASKVSQHLVPQPSCMV